MTLFENDAQISYLQEYSRLRGNARDADDRVSFIEAPIVGCAVLSVLTLSQLKAAGPLPTADSIMAAAVVSFVAAANYAGLRYVYLNVKHEILLRRFNRRHDAVTNPVKHESPLAPTPR